MARSLRSARVLSGALLLGAVGAALAPAGPDALVPFKMLAASAASQTYIALVVDFGDGTTTTHCVPVAPGESDEQALAQVYSVEANGSGLICDINNIPRSDTSQCLQTAGNNQFYYWSYWHGSTGTWEYANGGPAGYTTSNGDVEGWKFQNPGADNPTAPAPGASPNFANICAADLTPATTVPMPPSPPPTPTPTTAFAHNSTSSNGGGGSNQPGHTTTTTSKSAVKATTTSVAGAHVTTTAVSHDGTKSGNGSNSHAVKTALASSSQPASGSGGSPILPVVVVGAAIVLLGVFSFLRWRRRPAEE